MNTVTKTVRSFVRRNGRQKKQNLAQECLARYLIQPASLPPLLDDWSARYRSTTLEIGFGTGATLFQQAFENPTHGYIGIEVYKTGITQLLKKLADNSLDNVAVAEGDAFTLLSHDWLSNRFDNVQILFPDPWPKRKHHKRRLIQSDFISLLHDSIKQEGLLYLATDWEEYAAQMLSQLECSAFINTYNAGQFAERPSMIPITKFEERGQRLGHPIRYLVFKKC